jgi:hypothetical protein
MSVKEHEEIVSNVAEILRHEGYKVILIKKPIPDIIAIKGDKTLACEITSSRQAQAPYKKKLKYTKYGFDTDDLMIISNSIRPENETPPEAYYLAVTLMKNGVRYKQILSILEEKFDVIISQPTLSRWKSGHVKPYSVRELEGRHKSNFT